MCHRIFLNPILDTPGLAPGLFILQKYRKGGMAGARYAQFLEAVKKSRGQIVVIYDGLSSHRAPGVQALLRRWQGMIRVHRLPAYNPDLNAVEMIWGMGKSQVSRYGAKDRHALFGALTRFYRRLKGKRQLLRRAFPNVACSAS